MIDGDSCGSSIAASPEMDRNPSPPPEEDETEAGEEADAIGETVYSKHWLFSTLASLIQMVTDQESGPSDCSMELTDVLEEDVCKVWDMAMDKDVAVFLQEFKAPDILLGVIAKSRSPWLTEICVGILGNMACFHDTRVFLSQNSDLGAVLLLLLGDNDPPTLLETCRLLLTCMSQPDVAPLWLERIRQQPAACGSLCFIMSSSTNGQFCLMMLLMFFFFVAINIYETCTTSFFFFFTFPCVFFFLLWFLAVNIQYFLFVSFYVT